ncbi:solute carrier family 17 member 9 isoform X2 [Zootermopsis nevadensis]|uniref:solute carrier family 17 member 9 isoform X2 n=1 Tax=Zootermopsis nevadensis TaxID=136037 RepID=UPI000B8E3FBA|nr:solute carrier family 17 member 9 isoform X2 [Zootermopsis nevadensis]
MEEADSKYPLLPSEREDVLEDCNLWTRTEKRKWLCTLFIGTSALYASRTSVPLLVPAIALERKWSKTNSGTVLSSFFWGYTLTQVIGGYLSDRIGGHKVILTAAVGWSLFTFCMPDIIRLFSAQETSVNFIVIMRILHGAFQGVHFPSMSSLTSRHLAEKERTSFFSILTSGSAIGTLFTGTFGSYLLDYYGWPAVFYVIGTIGVVWTLVLRKIALALERRKAVINSVPCKLHSSLRVKDNIPVPWIRLFQRSEFWSCVIGHACQNNCFFLLLSWLPTYFHDTFPEAKGWVVNMVPWLFCIPSTFLGKWLSEKLIAHGHSITYTRKVIEVICLGSQALGLILIGAGSEGGLNVLSVLAHGLLLFEPPAGEVFWLWVYCSFPKI